jgi:hypothetical protein
MTTISEEFHREQATLRREAADRLADLFPSLNFRDLDGSAPGWVLNVERVVSRAHANGIELAEDAYRQMRREAGESGRVAFVLPTLDRGKMRAELLYLGPRSAKQALATGQRIPRVAEAVFTQTTREALLQAMAGPRETIRRTAVSDPRAAGWKRITNTGACQFCRMLADRGAVYRERTATFSAHRGCGCSAAPVFLGGEVGPEASVQQYLASRKTRTKEQRQQLRDYLNTNYPRGSAA